MALPITIPNTFATESTNIPLSDLDANFTTVASGVNGIGNGTNALANVAVTGGTINGAVIGGSNAVAGTFTTLTANAATFTSLTVTGGGGEESGGIAPTGSITMWAGAVASPPTGWLACNGANVSRTTYSELFDVVGTTWGAGDGSTTFTLPNLLNKFSVGAGDTYALAATGGSANAIVVSHTHTANSAVTDPGHTHQVWRAGSNGDGGAFGAWGASVAPQYPSGSNTTGITVSTTIDTTGSSGTNANLPPYVAVGYIIKT
jgi:microcystin-dependent protein